ncbi:UNVERIFIED_CONTAM: hypothetical protein K2H54_054417 [Gekko kuhli]
MCYLLKEKLQNEQKLRDYVAMVSKKFNRNSQIIQSDHGESKEYGILDSNTKQITTSRVVQFDERTRNSQTAVTDNHPEEHGDNNQLVVYGSDPMDEVTA